VCICVYFHASIASLVPWLQVIVGFFTSVSVLYLVFPFFTYVPSSGIFGRELPQARKAASSIPVLLRRPGWYCKRPVLVLQ